MSIRDEPTERPRTSTRDYDELRHRLERWLRSHVPGATLSELVVPPSNGMSSETVLFTATAADGSAPRPLVARIAPDPAADPVFQSYDMERQFRTMEMVAEHTEVPVPRVLWLETGTTAIGAPFFVMERVEGLVPPDVMPYTFGDNWFADADPADRQRLERSAIGVLARLHELHASGPAGFLRAEGHGSHLRLHVAKERGYYDWVVADGVRSPLVERGFEWLDAHWPSNEHDDVLSWGDARIGNIMFDDFEPAAVLDWEMAGIGPREIDLGWMIYMHRFFQDLVEDLGLPGLPDVLRRDAVVEHYRSLTGHVPQDLDFYTAYAALRYAVVSFRIARRSVHLDGAVMPDDPDDALMNRRHLERMLDGVYW